MPVHLASCSVFLGFVYFLEPIMSCGFVPLDVPALRQSCPAHVHVYPLSGEQGDTGVSLLNQQLSVVSTHALPECIRAVVL